MHASNGVFGAQWASVKADGCKLSTQRIKGTLQLGQKRLPLILRIQPNLAMNSVLGKKGSNMVHTWKGYWFRRQPKPWAHSSFSVHPLLASETRGKYMIAGHVSRKSHRGHAVIALSLHRQHAATAPLSARYFRCHVVQAGKPLNPRWYQHHWNSVDTISMVMAPPWWHWCHWDSMDAVEIKSMPSRWYCHHQDSINTISTTLIPSPLR